MLLCFGTFVKVLNLCRNNQLATQNDLISKIILAIDPEHSCLNLRDNTINSHTITKLLNCSYNFSFSDKRYIENADQKKLSENFFQNVLPLLDEDRKIHIIIFLLYLIKQDSSIDAERSENFKIFWGIGKRDWLNKDTFSNDTINFADFLSRMLLYTTCSNIDNRKGKETLSYITLDYISEIVSSFQSECTWDIPSQTLKFPFIEKYNIFIKEVIAYDINGFVNTDPGYLLPAKYADECDSLINDINNKNENLRYFFDSPSPTKFTKLLVSKGSAFCSLFDEYHSYLAPNMKPTNDFFIPIISEKAPLFQEFLKTTRQYRQNLISTFNEIPLLRTCYIKHIPFI